MKNNQFIFLLAACLSLVLFSCQGKNNKKERLKTIEVTGSAEMEIVPNEIYMSFTLKEYLDATKKKVKLELIKTDFLAQCKAAGIADSSISIASYTGNERWDYYWYKRRKTEPDFMATISYSVKVSSSDKLDKLVDAINDKAIESFHITKTSHSDIEKLRKEVKTKALIATKNKAEYLTQSIGEELGDAIHIEEIEGGGNSYRSAMSNMSNEISQMAVEYGDDNSSSPGFQKIKLRYEMKAEFRLK